MTFRKEFSIVEKINLLERWLLVHSYIYYDLDQNVCSDEVYDGNCIQLYGMMNDFPDEFKQSRYHSAFYDFEIGTGMQLYPRLEGFDKQRVVEDANFILNITKKGS